MSERLFLAIGFDNEICLKLSQGVKKVKINLDRAEITYKWVHHENYHVTLVFLGETKAEQKNHIVSIMQSMAAELSQFELYVSGVDAFDSDQKARVIYCGVQNKKNLRSMVQQIQEKLRMPPAENYSPHLTIARLRNPSHVRDIISPVRRKDFFKVPVTEIRLYKSTLVGHFPSYKILERFPLGPKQSVSEME